MRFSWALCAAGMLLATAGAAQQPNPFVGSWNLVGQPPDAAYVYWLGVEETNGQLRGMFLNRTGNPNPLAYVRMDGAELVFRAGPAAAPSGPEYRARLDNGRLIGRHTVTTPSAPGGTTPGERIVHWVGERRPIWTSANANGAHTYEPPVLLFDGKSLDGFVGQIAGRALGWTIAEGVASNQASANNLVSRATFRDFKLEAEYRLGPKGNSGFYLRGRYELQALDDFADTTTRRDLAHMAVYGRTAPLTNASRPAGEWQRMTAVLVGNRVTVTLNGQRVHDNTEILGITGGALDASELAPGPLMIQGDHAGVELRRVVVTPIASVGR